MPELDYDAQKLLDLFDGVFEGDNNFGLVKPANSAKCDVQLRVDPDKTDYNIEIKVGQPCEVTEVLLRRVDGQAIKAATIGTLKADAMLVPGTTNPGKYEKTDSVSGDVKKRPLHFRSNKNLSAYEAYVVLDDSSNFYEVTFPGSSIRLANPEDAKIVYENAHLDVSEQDRSEIPKRPVCKGDKYDGCRRHLIRNVPMAWDYAVYPLGNCNDPLQGDEFEYTAYDGSRDLFIVKAHPEAIMHFGTKAIHSSYFKARLNDLTTSGTVKSTRKGAPSMGYKWDSDLDGFVISVEHTVPGNFKLEVELEWYYGLNEIGNSQVPWNMGRYDGFGYSVCQRSRARVGLLEPTAEIVIKGDKKYATRKCGREDGPDFIGHWLTKKEKGCDEECTGIGALTDDYLSLHNDGSGRSVMFVPDNCRPHIYTDKNILQCAREKKISWLAVMGDSTIREVASMLLTKFPPHDSAGKFSTVKMPVFYDETNKNLGSFTIAFEAPSSFIDMCNDGMDNIEKEFIRNFPKEAKLMDDRFNLRLTNESEARPEIFITNSAVAYSAWKLRFPEYIKFMYNIANYFKEAFQAEREGLPPLRIIWFIAVEHPDRAHPGTINVNSQRIRWQNEVAVHILKEVLGERIEFFNGFHVLEGEWKYTWDGLHALRTGTSQWHGIEANVVIQMLLNMVFDDCKGTDEGEG
ncbi:hypothetical protein, variant [Sphaeroforma arctica JP610]|nr:hypothetical protein, variant [Sphaeroforma arctica JP610]KNC79764.1 hypothetical protein, variant [Sphaeroforma arctica JP610]|eukprot:XP_014153666.1 hypothetical protein, variant [Sphaeroforma arctica JP610]